MNILGSQIQEVWYLAGYKKRKFFCNNEETQEGYVLGQFIKNFSEFQKTSLSQILYFSYRKDLQIKITLKDKSVSNVNDDIGWGCMIRSGQMLFANLFKLHLQDNFDFSLLGWDYNYQILRIFNESKLYDQSTTLFSFKNIIENAHQSFDYQPSTWMNPNQILCCFHELFQKYQESIDDRFWDQINQNKLEYFPIEILHLNQHIEYQNFFEVSQLIASMIECDCGRVIDFQNSLDKIQRIANRLFKNQKTNIKENEFEIVNIIDKTDMSDMEEFYKIVQSEVFDHICPKCNRNGQNQQRLFSSITTRMGLQEPDEKLLEQLKFYMNQPYFAGMIGGSGKLGLYIYGYQGDKFLYFDPHYVQTAQCKDKFQWEASYKCKDLLQISGKDLDCSIGLTFYIKDLKTLSQFIADIVHVTTIKSTMIGIISTSKVKVNKINAFKRQFYEQYMTYIDEKISEYQCEQQQKQDGQFEYLIDSDINL